MHKCIQVFPAPDLPGDGYSSDEEEDLWKGAERLEAAVRAYKKAWKKSGACAREGDISLCEAADRAAGAQGLKDEKRAEVKALLRCMHESDYAIALEAASL